MQMRYPSQIRDNCIIMTHLVKIIILIEIVKQKPTITKTTTTLKTPKATMVQCLRLKHMLYVRWTIHKYKLPLAHTLNQFLVSLVGILILLLVYRKS